MRLVKLFFFVLFVSALFVGAYWLIIKPGGNTGIQTAGGGLRQMCMERIGAYGDSIALNGWSDDYLTAAQVIVSGHANELSPAEVSQLDNALQSTFIAKVDSLIRDCYGSSMTDGQIANGSRLHRAYAGLDKLAAEYPSIKSSRRWTALSELRKAHRDIYNFGKLSFSPSARLELKFAWVGKTPIISMNTLLDFDSYANSMRLMRDQLNNRRNNIDELRTSPWTGNVLDRDRIEAKLSEGRTSYRDRENRGVAAFASSLMPKVNERRRSATESATEIVTRLDNIETYLTERNIDAAPINNVKNQIRRIYITN